MRPRSMIMYLHSNLFILIPNVQQETQNWLTDLHSNLFILIHFNPFLKQIRHNNLHSNLFILIQVSIFTMIFRIVHTYNLSMYSYNIT